MSHSSSFYPSTRQGIKRLFFFHNARKKTGVLSIVLFHQEGLYSSA